MKNYWRAKSEDLVRKAKGNVSSQHKQRDGVVPFNYYTPRQRKIGYATKRAERRESFDFAHKGNTNRELFEQKIKEAKALNEKRKGTCSGFCDYNIRRDNSVIDAEEEHKVKYKGKNYWYLE